ncbi:TPA_asm: hypothetical protein [Altiarchaeum virus]|nr:MAG: hypothetical protein BWK75_01220 [Candidatus Altiarchaeales archaeon A3]DAZ85510.1 TPA_asm: hypothetical protein [Altiarchaeum virus]
MSEFIDNFGKIGKIFFAIGLFVVLLLALILTVWIPTHQEILISVNILFNLTLLSFLWIILDKINLYVDLFFEISKKNAKKEILFCFAAFGFFFILPNLHNFLSFGSSTFIFGSVSDFFSTSILNALINTQFNIFAETLLFTSLPIGIARIMRHKINTQNLLSDKWFWFFALALTIILASAFHIGSYVFSQGHTIEEGMGDLIPIAIMFSIWTAIGLIKGNILIVYFAHAGWNLGFLWSITMSIV